MNLKIIFILLLTIIITSPSLSQEINCDDFEKFSAKYIECTAKKIKENASEKISKGKKKIDNTSFGKKFDELKKTKTLSDLIKKN
tara:strand:- start:199 stop:453 length:255 start_codon:yes stop_codon:yes gene_type:complete